MLKILLLLAAFALSTLILYQDFKERWVSLFALLGLGLTGILYSSLVAGAGIVALDIGLNVLLVSMILLLLRLYFGLKGQKAFIDVVLGKGDIVILYMFCFWFTFEHFIYFYVGGMFFSLLSFLIYLKWKDRKEMTVPLAGLLAIPFQVYLLLITIQK